MGKYLLVFFAAACSVMLVAAVRFYTYAVTLHGQPSEIVVSVPQGATLDEICTLLKEEAVIDDPFLFKLLVKVNRADQAIQSGEYAFVMPLAPLDVLGSLTRGDTVVYAITVPEGSTISDIAVILSNAGIGSVAHIASQCTNPKLIQLTGQPVYSLEGFLFPDTYHYQRDTDPDIILKNMIFRFMQVYSEESALAGKHSTELSDLETVTLASMVEKETACSSEKPLIAAVFINRLKRNMRLECDPTVIYGLRLEDPGFTGRLRTRHLRRETSYNTYRIHGLPPGPICCPGRDSLRAVLQPADTSFLYFVSKNDGTHKFSKTYAEHNRAVLRYQK